MNSIAELHESQAALLAGLLGIRITVLEKDAVEGEMVVRPDICTTGHILHGGAIMAFADTLGAVATSLNLRDGQGTTTLESKTNFLSAAPEGETVRARTAPLHRGGRTQVWQTNITRADGKLVAQITQTQMVLA